MAKIYTRAGDAGDTGLFGGGRLRKDALRIEAIGSIDETNAALGVVRMELARGGVAPVGFDDLLATVQHRLFDLGAELATVRADMQATDWIREDHVLALEQEIDRYDAQLDALRAFILPGGCAAAAHLHLARCICRRAERRLVELAAAEPVRQPVLAYVNRLGDLLFVMARLANQANHLPDVTWQQAGEGQGSRVEGRVPD